MEESLILSKFDTLIKASLVFYDERQKTIGHIDGELEFKFILTSALAKKPTIQSLQPQGEKSDELHNQRRDGSDIATGDYEIGDIGSTHFVIANKFCFARPHLMLLTSDGYRRQYEPLDQSDLEATWTALTAIGKSYVAFFNCGQDAGCSRLHKHLQLMPMPVNTFAAFLDSESLKEPNVPFQWFYHRFEPEHMTTDKLIKIYMDLLQQATTIGEGRSEHANSAPPGAACPHNMILTNRWMIIIPRRRAAINTEAGANSMGMLGVIAVATEHEVDNWVRLGLTEALKVLGVPKEIEV
ncbi:hypothetical protein F5884DRAFT_802116 [Xylogone sp. PMI_703]|nr:hypothetical protein F5884DRAFT_802116 [Xylogone sp. PMI_703]